MLHHLFWSAPHKQHGGDTDETTDTEEHFYVTHIHLLCGFTISVSLSAVHLPTHSIHTLTIGDVSGSIRALSSIWLLSGSHGVAIAVMGETRSGRSSR